MTDALTAKDLDTLVAYCDLACKTGGLNAAAEALLLAKKLLAMKAALTPTES